MWPALNSPAPLTPDIAAGGDPDDGDTGKQERAGRRPQRRRRGHRDVPRPAPRPRSRVSVPGCGVEYRERVFGLPRLTNSMTRDVGRRRRAGSRWRAIGDAEHATRHSRLGLQNVFEGLIEFALRLALFSRASSARHLGHSARSGFFATVFTSSSCRATLGRGSCRRSGRNRMAGSQTAHGFRHSSRTAHCAAPTPTSTVHDAGAWSLRVSSAGLGLVWGRA
jgi:hypothetical protein